MVTSPVWLPPCVCVCVLIVGCPPRSACHNHQHRTDFENAPDTPFDFTEENYAIVRTIIAKYPDNYKASACIPLLDLAQRQVLRGLLLLVVVVHPQADTLHSRCLTCGRSFAIPLLQVGNFLPLSAMNKVASILEMPPIRVYETASFYTMFNREKVGKYFIQLCGTTPCMVCGAQEIKQTIEKHLGIHDGRKLLARLRAAT